MVRRYDETLETRTARGTPDAFVWRGRLYVVRGVLDHWRERRAWWRTALDEPLPAQGGVLDGARELPVWRVEASAGRLAAAGVYDIAAEDRVPSAWRLLRVAD